MYCPNCGDLTTQGLKYCKRCGTNLSAPTTPVDQKATFPKMMGMLLPVAAVAIGGFIALFATVYNLGERPGFDTRALIGIMAFGGATVVCVVGLIVWLLLRLSGYQPLPSTQDRGIKPIARDYTHPQLTSPPMGIGSVTENTTRNFDPAVYRDRDDRE